MSSSISLQQETLLKSAAHYGLPNSVMGKVVELLTRMAQELEHSQYFCLRHPDGSWVVVQGEDTEIWFPAWGHRDDALFSQRQLGALEIEEVGVLDLLLQGMGLQTAQGILFYDHLGDRQFAKAVSQPTLKAALQSTLENSPPKNQPPSHLA